MSEVLEVLLRSLTVSGSATLLALAVGIPLGTAVALRPPGRRALATLVNTGLAVPTVVVGLAVALLLWRSGPLGDLGLIYTLRGMVLAQFLLATPLITAITLAALQQLPADLMDTLRGLGASRLQLVLALWGQARLPLLAAAMAGFGHAISEVGAATIVGGNLRGQTQVMTTAIVEDLGRGDVGSALVYASVLLALALAVYAVLTSVQQRAAWAPS